MKGRYVYSSANLLEQMRRGEALQAEFRRRLTEAGFIFGEGAAFDEIQAGPGVDPDAAERIWKELTTSN